LIAITLCGIGLTQEKEEPNMTLSEEKIKEAYLSNTGNISALSWICSVGLQMKKEGEHDASQKDRPQL
jgi:hypothetical protein